MPTEHFEHLPNREARRRDPQSETAEHLSHDPLAGALLVQVPRAAEIMGMSRTTIYGLIQSGELESLKIGSRRLIPSDAIRSYIAHLRDAA